VLAGRARPRAVVIVNPNAGSISKANWHGVITKLGERFDVEAHATTGRNVALSIASEAARTGAPVVVAVGGDGVVNEVVNGVAGTSACLGIVAGGTMNVFARSLGLPSSPLEAADHLLGPADLRPRTVTLGRMDDRYFTFAAGCGFDAEAAERVERDVPSKRRFGQAFFYWSAFRVLASAYRHRAPYMTLSGGFGEVGTAMVIASNAGPYAWLAGRRVEVAPGVRLDGGVDVFALRRMRLESLPMYAYRSVVSGDLASSPDAFYAADLDGFEVTASAPFSRHVDGEPVAPSTSARFSVAHKALQVLA